MPSLEELEAMADEDDAQENSDAAAEEILNSILEDEESGEEPRGRKPKLREAPPRERT